MADVTKLNKAFKEDAQKYSFNVESELFHHLPKSLKKLWKVETEQHFINGMIHMLENPSGGALLYVNRKSYEIGLREALNSLWNYPEMTTPKVDRNCLIEMIDGHIYIAHYSGKLWSFADGYPVGKDENGDIIYSSWCSIDPTYEVKRWCYVQALFPEKAKESHENGLIR